jgi:acyl-coenzyme A synthetase/AMP-(fatty) acid ligase
LKQGQDAEVNEIGELCIAGVGLARGYIQNPSLTESKFVHHPVHKDERIYRTGDLARWLPDGNVEYLGREDQQIKIRGVRIELGEIENTIREHPSVADAVVVVQRFSDTITPIVAYVVLKPGVPAQEIKPFLKEKLPDYMIPNRFEMIDAIPLGPNGKADRAALSVPVKPKAASPAQPFRQ